MTKYEIIKKIIESEKVSEDTKVNYIQSFLLNWLTEDDLKWLWEK